MDINNMRNIVILKDLPSNLVEEAFVVLKKNQRIKKLEYAENNFDTSFENTRGKNEDEYIVKEAELLISNYISKLEKQDITGKKENLNLVKKYNKIKLLTIILSITVLINLIYILNM